MTTLTILELAVLKVEDDVRRWDKSREALRLAEKRLDKAQAEQHQRDAEMFEMPFNDTL